MPASKPGRGKPSPAAAPQAPESTTTPAPAAKIADELARRLPVLFDRTSAPNAASSRLPTIPPILLEGDRPSVSANAPAPTPSAIETPGASDAPLRFVPAFPEEGKTSAANSEAESKSSSGSGEFALQPPRAASRYPAEATFPRSGALWLTARDPFCVLVHWQIPAGELATYARAHRGGTWRLRVHLDSVAGPLVQEQLLPERADHRFMPVFQPGARYVAELGFRFADGGWRGLALSSPASTPTDAPAEIFAEAEVRSAPAEPVTPDLLAQLPPDHPEQIPAPRYATSMPAATATFPSPASLPSPRQAQWLNELVWEPVASPATAPSSAQVADWQAREVSRMVPGGGTVPRSLALPNSAEAAQLFPGGTDTEVPASEEIPAVPVPPPGFWFKVNAELIIYGSTERDARVTIAGRPVALRPDGSFSFRFALPDGDFNLPAIAVNAAGTDGRAARLRFTRATVLAGDVGVHPQDTQLKPPVAEAIA